MYKYAAANPAGVLPLENFASEISEDNFNASLSTYGLNFPLLEILEIYLFIDYRKDRLQEI